MSTKLLLMLGLLFIIVSAYFYAHNDATLTKVNLKPSDIDYQAEQVNALQTNKAGGVNYQLTAKDITHYQKANIAVITQPNIIFRPKNEREVTLVANKAQIDETKQVANLTGEVIMTSHPLTATNSQNVLGTQSIKMVGKDFVGDLANNKVATNQPIVVTQGNNRFEAKQFAADLSTGDYGFKQVSMTFIPSTMNQ